MADTTLEQILRALRAPTPEDGAEWRVVAKSKDKSRWLWSKYPTGDFVRQRLTEACSGGFQIVEYETQELEGEVVMSGAILVFDPQNRSSPPITVLGIGGKEKESYQTWSNTKKAALTNMVKNAALYLGVGLDLHSEDGVWTAANTDPEGRETDDSGRPGNQPAGTKGTKGKKSAQNNNKKKDPFTALWQYCYEREIEKGKVDETLEKVRGDPEKALILLKEEFGE
jgi:hypothetical protein